MPATKKFSATDAKKRTKTKDEQDFWLKTGNDYLDAGWSREEAAKFASKAVRREVNYGRLPSGVGHS